MIEVITTIEPRDVYDKHHRLIVAKGTEVVSHGVCHETGRNVCLPCDTLQSFMCHLKMMHGTYFLK